MTLFIAVFVCLEDLQATGKKKEATQTNQCF